MSSGENGGREAAEAAIASPLLEDIDFSGARGVLVNITAGLDMTIGEFEAVGEALKAFASESATVVVGTVIDPELTDELRVTVVVTGLGYQKGGSDAARSLRSTRNDGTTDYHQLDRPTFMRNQDSIKRTVEVEDSRGKDIDYLDIPAFLRRQED